MPLLTFIKDLPLLRQFFTGAPGPWLAKVTYLWKLYHLLRGSYRKTLWQLHQRYGSLVQVGPNEYSLSGFDKRLHFVAHQDHHVAPFDSAALDSLTKDLVMINLLRKESLIQSCNAKLVELLVESANSGCAVSLPDLLVRHAYEVLMATTTGELAGFLDKTTNPSKIDKALKDWKLHAVLYGSYLRFHPSIKYVMERCGFRSQGDNRMDPALEVAQKHAKESDLEPLLPHSDIESRIALALAGADPVGILLSKAVEHIYSTPDLLHSLRQELNEANIPEPPSFRELVVRKPRMPLLHAVLSECRRTEALYTSGLSYVAPASGVRTEELPIPAGSTIVLEPIAHLNQSEFGRPTEWDPNRWLSEAALNLKRFLPAYNILDRDQKIEQFQVLIATSILAEILPSFQLSSDDFACSNVSLTETGKTLLERASGSASQTRVEERVLNRQYPPRLIEMETIERCFGREGAKELLTRFDPSHEVLSGSPLHSYAVPDKYERFRLEKAFDSIYGWRLRRTWDKHNSIMHVGMARDVPNLIKSKHHHQHVRQPLPATDGAPSEQEEHNSAKTDDDRKSEDMDTLKKQLGDDVANLLFERFDPGQKIFSGDPIISLPIPRVDRAEVHHAVDRIFGSQLEHKTDYETDRIHIGPAGSVPHFVRPGRYNEHNRDRRGGLARRGGRGTSNGRANRGVYGNSVPQRSPPYQGVVGTAESQTAQHAPVNAAWGGFAEQEHSRVSAFTSAESWDVQKKQMEAEKAAAERDGPAPSTVRFTETFKQVSKDLGGRLTGPRKAIHTETTYHDGSSKPANGVENKSSEAGAAPAEEAPRVKAVPPHVRRAQMERERARQRQEPCSTGWVAARLPFASSE